MTTLRVHAGAEMRAWPSFAGLKVLRSLRAHAGAKGVRNQYDCGQCGHVTTVIHADAGYTARLIECRGTGACEGVGVLRAPSGRALAESRHYLNLTRSDGPTHEWYRDTTGALALRPVAWTRQPLEQLLGGPRDRARLRRILAAGCTLEGPPARLAGESETPFTVRGWGWVAQHRTCEGAAREAEDWEWAAAGRMARIQIAARRERMTWPRRTA